MIGWLTLYLLTAVSENVAGGGVEHVQIKAHMGRRCLVAAFRLRV